MPQRQPAQQHGQQREGPGDLISRQKVDEYDAEQREHRAERKVDAAGDDHEPLAERKHTEEADQIGHVEQVHQRQEGRIDRARDGGNHHQQQAQAEFFLDHGLAASTVSSAWPIASRNTLYSLNCGRSSTPLTLPSCITATRSETPMTSSMSEEIITIATP